MPAEFKSESEKERLNFLVTRLTELKSTASQILIFLSFAIVAGVTFIATGLESPRKAAVHLALRWWIGAIFPTVIGIIPMKEVRDGNLRWYRFLLWMRFALMWSAILCIFVGAVEFFKAV
ncbi:MAG: hypothetical protein WA875_10740 [Candidatus Acidiferrales bacterium]